MASYIPFLIKIAMLIFESAISKNKNNKELRELYTKLIQSMRASGLTTAKSRLESESQIQAGNDIWDEREKAKQDNGGSSS